MPESEPLDTTGPEPLMSAQELAVLADAWFAKRAERLAHDKVGKALKTDESAMEAKLIEQMLRSKISAVGGGTVVTYLPAPTLEPVKQNWQLFWEHVMKTGDSSLIEQRIGRAAIKERWANGETIPGVTSFPVYNLNRSKPK